MAKNIFFSFSSRNKLMDVTGNGYNLSTFNAESEVIHLLEIQLDIQIQIIQ